MYLGEAQNVVIRLCQAGDPRILEVIGETDHPRFVPGENEASSSKSIQETPQLLLPPKYTLEIQQGAGHC